MDAATQDRVTVAEKATAPMLAAPSSEQNNQAESTMPEPDTATCGTCKAVEDLYTLGSGFLCLGCIGAAVSVAANDIWPGSVRYDKAFEDSLW